MLAGEGDPHAACRAPARQEPRRRVASRDRGVPWIALRGVPRGSGTPTRPGRLPRAGLPALLRRYDAGKAELGTETHVETYVDRLVARSAMNPEHEPGIARVPEQPDSPEVIRADRPRIYVASLSDYNNGRLHGAWIDADQDFESIGDEIGEMLSGSRYDPAEEYAIHDYEGFGAYRVDEYESIEDVARIGRGIAEHGLAYAAFAALGRFDRPWHRQARDLHPLARGGLAEVRRRDRRPAPTCRSRDDSGRQGAARLPAVTTQPRASESSGRRSPSPSTVTARRYRPAGESWELSYNETYSDMTYRDERSLDRREQLLGGAA